LFVVAALAAAKSPREACAGDGAPPGAVAMKEFAIPDAALSAPGRPLAYMSVLAPADWKAEGALYPRAGDPCGLRFSLKWRAASPDGRSTVETFPEAAWTASRREAQFSSCPSRPVFSAAEYAEDLLSRHGVKAPAATWRAREDIAAPFRTPPAAGGETTADAGELSFRAEGASDALLIAAVVIWKPAHFIPEDEWRGYAPPAILATAPAGKLDADLVEAVRASAIVNPDWQAAQERLSGADAAPMRKTVAARPPFPNRTAGAPVTKCGRAYAPLSTPLLWRRDDGRVYYIPRGAASVQD
ncbi:MAG: hypothetical protein HXY21_05910, partial [Parvularculaceae bacterium]|nr:hypothetical protein [Parvularculaceae bacterium]